MNWLISLTHSPDLGGRKDGVFAQSFDVFQMSIFGFNDYYLENKMRKPFMSYVDGYVIPIKKTNIRQYKKLATLGCKVWMEYGALTYFECSGDDLKTKWGLSFIKMCKLKPSETVIFAFIVYKSKTDRNRINALVMKDPRMNPSGKKPVKMPFDMKRFSMGGFKTLVSK